jgi:hypothetical protein
MRYDPSNSLLAGMDLTVLRTRLTQMQEDYLDLVSGRKVMSANYSQGDGAKAVAYTKATLGELAMVIRQVQAQLGIVCKPRGAIRPVF